MRTNLFMALASLSAGRRIDKTASLLFVIQRNKKKRTPQECAFSLCSRIWIY